MDWTLILVTGVYCQVVTTAIFELVIPICRIHPLLVMDVLERKQFPVCNSYYTLKYNFANDVCIWIQNINIAVTLCNQCSCDCTYDTYVLVVPMTPIYLLYLCTCCTYVPIVPMYLWLAYEHLNMFVDSTQISVRSYRPQCESAALWVCLVEADRRLLFVFDTSYLLCWAGCHPSLSTKSLDDAGYECVWSGSTS